MHVKQSTYPSSTPDFRLCSWPIKPHSREEGLGFAPSLWLVVLVACLLNAAGCGGSSGNGKSAASPTPAATATATVQEGAIFEPVAPPLSPNTVDYTYTPSSQQAVSSDRVQLAAAAATAAPITLNHYFYLVNGAGLPAPASNGVRPNPSSTPSVLTVNGPAPNGAPNPNGGTWVGVEVLNPDAAGRQLWKAVGAANGYFFLRSAESFETDSDPGALPSNPSMLLGYGATAFALDLGYFSKWGTAVFANQAGDYSGAPAFESGNSNFQQWSYDTTTAQLTNLNANGQLYNSSPTAGVASQSPASNNEWYTYPNYLMEQVVNEPNSNPPFPAATDDGETAAYNYISNLLNVGNSACTYEGTTYTGIRCEYYIVSTPEALTNCYPTILNANNSPPTSFNGTPISSSDWSTVAPQLENECSYAIGVQNLFKYYNTIFTQVFTNDSDSITPLADDVGVSGNTMVNLVPAEIIEGVIYTTLSATGTLGGVVANVMETAFNAALAAPGGETLNQKLATQVSALYTSLATSFQQVAAGSNMAETAILEDWGRLNQIGPATNIAGYNGLGLTANDVNGAEAAAIKGYKLTVMAQLMSVAPWSLYTQVASDTTTPETDYFPSVPSQAQYSYSTFGSATGSYNISVLAKLNSNLDDNNYPDSQVMTTDIMDNGGNSFELFNGLNLWASLPFGIYTNFGCAGFVTTLYNATPTDLTVFVGPNSGYIAASGSKFAAGGSESTGGSTNNYAFELRPYGYLPIYAAALENGTNNATINVSVTIVDYSYSPTAGVGSFNFEVENACADPKNFGTPNISSTDGYSLAHFGYHSSSGTSNPWGVWIPIQNSSLSPQ